MRTELTAALELARQLPTDELPRLLGELEEIRATAQLRLTSPAVTKSGEQWLSIEQMADRMHKSTDYVYRHAKDWPFAKRLDKAWLFSEKGFDAFLKKSR